MELFTSSIVIILNYCSSNTIFCTKYKIKFEQKKSYHDNINSLSHMLSQYHQQSFKTHVLTSKHTHTQYYPFSSYCHSRRPSVTFIYFNLNCMHVHIKPPDLISSHLFSIHYSIQRHISSHFPFPASHKHTFFILTHTYNTLVLKCAWSTICPLLSQSPLLTLLG